MEEAVEITFAIRQQIRLARSEAKRKAIELVSLGERRCKKCGCYLDCFNPACYLCRNRKSHAKARGVYL